MAEVSIQVGGRSYAVHCRDGEEDHLHSIAALVDAKAQDAAKAVGGVNETRHLLFAALLLADALSDAQKGATAPAASPAPAPPQPSGAPQPDYAPIIEKLAARIENLAERLESGAASS
jgi:cell division protein ZapA